jgi:hypothetical protein
VAARTVAARWVAGVVAVCAVIAGVAALTGSPAGAAAPPGQVITVRAATASSTTAVLEAWQRTATGSYRRVWLVYGPVG